MAFRGPEDCDITPQLLLQAYAAGIFPMGESAESNLIIWIDPTERGIIPLEDFRFSRSLAKTIRKTDYRVQVDTAFRETVQGCALSRGETWINNQIFELYGSLHDMGHAHSIEVWSSDGLIGGLYGVRLGGAFFGESMFSLAPDTSKIALVYLVARLKAGGFTLLDTQFVTAHLAQFGALEISRLAYRARLTDALPLLADFYAMPMDLSPEAVIRQARGTIVGA